MPKSLRKPQYTLHKPSGRARVRIDGHDHYLGEYGSPDSRDEYDKLITEWLARQDVGRITLTVDDLVLLFLEWADGYYRHPDGTPTGALHVLRPALRHLVREHGRTRVRDFGPLKLKAVRQAMIQAGCCRTNINRMVHGIRRVFSWGVENEYVPPNVYAALKAVPALKRGRTTAVESDPVQPVPEGTVNTTLEKLPSPLAAMVRLQLLTGARPGEVCAMRPCDVTIGTDGVWCYRPAQHKTAHHGKERRIYIGPEGQDVLRPFLDRDPEAHCFSPAESVAEIQAARRANRKSKVQPSQLDRSKPNAKRKPSDRYTKDSYCRSIQRACVKAEVEPWSPLQLRHSRATILRERYGLEAAQLVLGHSDPRITLTYAERDFAKAADIMRQIG